MCKFAQNKNTSDLGISKIKYFFLLLLALLFMKCDTPDRFEIPAVYLDFTIRVSSDVQFYDLTIPGLSMEIDAQMVGLPSLGYDNNGLIVYNNGDLYYAFDRTCPHDFPGSIPVNGDGTTSAKCPECSSVYLFPAFGVPTDKSVSKYPLKEYRTSYMNGILRVYN
jgi:hypothetical protein